MTKEMTESIHTKENLPGKFAPVNGLKVYYELYGAGQPLVMLHGGVGASEMFGANLAAFAANRLVIAVHLQAHGRTADIDRPLSYELMADDISAMLKYLKISQADILGYSLGGGVALQTAIRHPEMVHKLVLISTPARREDGIRKCWRVLISWVRRLPDTWTRARSTNFTRMLNGPSSSPR